jgi:hypothetical protein
MSQPPSPAERLDHAVDGVLDGLSPVAAAATAGTAPGSGHLVRLAADLRTVLAPPPVAPLFEARLGARLASAQEPTPARDPVAWALRHPGTLIVTGAVGSAVGVGVTGYAVWRSTRRASAAARLLHR